MYFDLNPIDKVVAAATLLQDLETGDAPNVCHALIMGAIDLIGTALVNLKMMHIELHKTSLREDFYPGPGPLGPPPPDLAG